MTWLLFFALAHADVAVPTPAHAPEQGTVEEDLDAPAHPDTPTPAWVWPAAGGGAVCSALTVAGGLGLVLVTTRRRS